MIVRLKDGLKLNMLCERSTGHQIRPKRIIDLFIITIHVKCEVRVVTCGNLQTSDFEWLSIMVCYTVALLCMSIMDHANELGQMDSWLTD